MWLVVLEGVATVGAGDGGKEGERGGETVAPETLPQFDKTCHLESSTRASHSISL